MGARQTENKVERQQGDKLSSQINRCYLSSQWPNVPERSELRVRMSICCLVGLLRPAAAPVLVSRPLLPTFPLSCWTWYCPSFPFKQISLPSLHLPPTIRFWNPLRSPSDVFPFKFQLWVPPFCKSYPKLCTRDPHSPVHACTTGKMDARARVSYAAGVFCSANGCCIMEPALT